MGIFKEICVKQTQLDNAIATARGSEVVRTREQIRLSAIAECIEFNEETLCTHKTWKNKEFDKAKQLEELVDILFFIAQLVNEYERSGYRNILHLDKNVFDFNKWEKRLDINTTLLELIESLSCKALNIVLLRYVILCIALGYTEEEIFLEYNRKWAINMDRINKDWKK
ncbi:dUTP diphosphatase [Cetobacterium sp.]|uniref:dUTP diphosphatase n=1 Tax=Cetobacterium sp. TaxID=2071632 RepID=UPI003F3E11B1